MNATFQKTSASAAIDGAPSRAHLKLNPEGETIVLQRDQHGYVRHAAGWTVHALAGTVWITQDGDIRDVVLQPGDTFVLDRSGPALLSPMGNARVSVTLCKGCPAGQRRMPKPTATTSFGTARPAFA